MPRSPTSRPAAPAAHPSRSPRSQTQVDLDRPAPLSQGTTLPRGSALFSVQTQRVRTVQVPGTPRPRASGPAQAAPRRPPQPVGRSRVAYHLLDAPTPRIGTPSVGDPTVPSAPLGPPFSGPATLREHAPNTLPPSAAPPPNALPASAARFPALKTSQRPSDAQPSRRSTPQLPLASRPEAPPARRTPNPQLRRRIYLGATRLTFNAVRKQPTAKLVAPAPAQLSLSWKVLGVAGLTFGGLCLAALCGALLAQHWAARPATTHAPGMTLATRLFGASGCQHPPGLQARALPSAAPSALLAASASAAPSAAPPPPGRAVGVTNETARPNEGRAAASTPAAARAASRLPASGI